MENKFTTGLMASGKSKILIEDYKASIKDGKHVVAFAASTTNKSAYIGQIESRAGTSLKCVYLNNMSNNYNLGIIFQEIEMGTKLFFIDEVQFLDKEFIKMLFSISENYKVEFHFYGLLSTFTGEFFEASKYLIDNLHSDQIKYIEMNCQVENCENKAEHNARIVDGEIVKDGKTFIEQKSNYLSLCNKHYLSSNLKAS